MLNVYFNFLMYAC